MRKEKPVDHYSYRSGIETAWRCPRAGYLNQFHLDTGIEKAPRAYWLDVGIAVHEGLANLLQTFSAPFDNNATTEALAARCIRLGLEHWDNCGQAQVLHDVTFREQRILIEALLWVFYFHSLPEFLKTFEILAVEHEITEVVKGRPRYMMMSRPDAIVRDRLTGEIVVISWKTIDDVNAWRRLFFRQDLQGMTEAWYSEQWLEEAQKRGYKGIEGTRVAYVQTIYLVKGTRAQVKGESGAYGGEAPEELGDAFAEEMEGPGWRQNSHLVYGYEGLDVGKDGVAKVKHAWRWQYVKPGNVSYSTLGKGYEKKFVTDMGYTVRDWVKALGDGKVFPMGDMTGGEHPLAKSVVWEMPSYRDAEMMASVLEQVKESERKRHGAHKEVKKAEAVVLGMPQEQWAVGMQSAVVPLLNKYFPMQLTSCSFPWRCQFQDICHGEKAGSDALVSLMVPSGYARRIPHHDPEGEKFTGESGSDLKVGR